MQSKTCESPASLPSVLKCDLRTTAKDNGPPTALEKSCQFQLSARTHAAVGGGQVWGSHRQISTGVSKLFKAPPAESPAASGLPLLPPAGSRASPTSLLGSLTSGHLGLAKI